MSAHLDKLESRRLMSASPALYAAGGGAYLTKFDPATGAVLATIHAPSTSPSDALNELAVDASGNIFGIEAMVGDIVRVDAQTNLASQIIPAGDHGMSTPLALAADPATGDLFVIDYNTLYHYSPTGTFLSKSNPLDTTDRSLAGIAISPASLIYLTTAQYDSYGVHFSTTRYLDSGHTTIGDSQNIADNDSTKDNSARLAIANDGTLFTADFGQEYNPATLYVNSYASDFTNAANFTPPNSSSTLFTPGETGKLYIVDNDGAIDAIDSETGTILGTAVPQPVDGSSFTALAYSPATASDSTYHVMSFHADSSVHYTGSNGVVDVSLKGSGAGELIFANDNPDPVKLLLTGTTLASTLSVGSNQQATFGEIEIDGSIGTLSAPQSDITSSLRVSGNFNTLRLRDLSGVVQIDGTLSTLKISIRNATSLYFTSSEPIQLLTANHWGKDAQTSSQLIAPSIDTLHISGSMTGDIRLSSNALALKTAYIHQIDEGEILTAGSIGTLVTGNLTFAKIFAGIKSNVSSSPMLASEFASMASIHSFHQTSGAKFTDSSIAAADIDTLRLGRMNYQPGYQAGITATHIGKLSAAPLAPRTNHNLHSAADSKSIGQLYLRIIEPV